MPTGTGCWTRDFEPFKQRIIDEYGAVSPAEFVAVISEAFFEKPALMKQELPELCEQLQNHYELVPTSW